MKSPLALFLDAINSDRCPASVAALAITLGSLVLFLGPAIIALVIF